MTKKKVLLTGASGSVGIKTFEELFSRHDNYNIKLLVRRSCKNKRLFRPYKGKIEIIWGDLRNYEDVEKAVDDQEVVIHIAAVIPPLAHYDPGLAYATNVGGTQNILKAMHKQQNQPKIIYASSIAVYGDRLKNPMIKITDPVKPSPGDYYTETKIKAENLIRKSGLDYSIFRLSYCTSLDSLKVHPLMFHMPLDTCIEIVDARDVGLALVNAIESDEIWGRCFNLAGGEKCRIRFGDYLDDMFEIMGFKRNFLPEEAFATKDFHCGFLDTQEIQDILKFQRYTLEDWYLQVEKWIGIKRYFIPLVRWFIKRSLLNKSEFYKS